MLPKALALAAISVVSIAHSWNVPLDHLNSDVRPIAYMALIEQKATEAGIDPEVAKAIAYCESEVQQFKPGGELYRGWQNPADVGIFQINEKYHLRDATKMNLDIHTTDGNIAYAMQLMKREGTHPWNASKPCWSKDFPSWG